VYRRAFYPNRPGHQTLLTEKFGVPAKEAKYMFEMAQAQGGGRAYLYESVGPGGGFMLEYRPIIVRCGQPIWSSHAGTSLNGNFH
jgi:hypothetical protein